MTKTYPKSPEKILTWWVILNSRFICFSAGRYAPASSANKNCFFKWRFEAWKKNFNAVSLLWITTAQEVQLFPDKRHHSLLKRPSASGNAQLTKCYRRPPVRSFNSLLSACCSDKLRCVWHESVRILPDHLTPGRRHARKIMICSGKSLHRISKSEENIRI